MKPVFLPQRAFGRLTSKPPGPFLRPPPPRQTRQSPPKPWSQILPHPNNRQRSTETPAELVSNRSLRRWPDGDDEEPCT